MIRTETCLRVHSGTASDCRSPTRGHSDGRDGGQAGLVRPRTYPENSRSFFLLESLPFESDGLVDSIIREGVRDEPKDITTTTSGLGIRDGAVVVALGHLDDCRWCKKENRSHDRPGEAVLKFGTRREGDGCSDNSNGGFRSHGKTSWGQVNLRSRGQYHTPRTNTNGACATTSKYHYFS